jgi:hypothetical protein
MTENTLENREAPAPHAPASTNGFAVASLVVGLLWLLWVGSVLALVFGFVAKRQIRERGQSGDGIATAGIVLGSIGVAFLLLSVVAAIS